MTKKFTENEYQKIVDCFDKLKKEYNMGILNPNVTLHFQEELFNFDLINDWPEIVAIANPATREEAKEKYVEKEKKYHWISKKRFNNGEYKVLVKSSDGHPIDMYHPSSKPCDSFTETEVREGCYNPDMFDREEVE